MHTVSSTNEYLMKGIKILIYCKKIMRNRDRELLFVTAFFIMKKTWTNLKR